MGDGVAVVRRVCEQHGIRAKIVLEHEDLIGAGLQQRPGDVERLLGPRLGPDSPPVSSLRSDRARTTKTTSG